METTYDILNEIPDEDMDLYLSEFRPGYIKYTISGFVSGTQYFGNSPFDKKIQDWKKRIHGNI